MRDNIEIDKLPEEMFIPDVADLFRVSTVSVNRWIRKFDLRGEKKNVAGVSKWVFTPQDISNYLKECRQ